ncbi:MAG: SpoIIE family protein phosphatase [Bacteroidia bacterium]
MKKLIPLLLFSFALSLFGQKDSVFRLSADMPGYTNQLKLIEGWKYQKGDDPKWADPGLDDSKWKYISSTLDNKAMESGAFENIGWFRLHIEADTQLVNKTLALLITQSGASEVYLDGKLIHSFGKINTKDPSMEERFNPQLLPADIRFENVRRHVLAVRYANARALSDFKKNGYANPGFSLKIGKLWEAVEWKYINSNSVSAIFMFYFSFFFALSFLHFMLFMYFKSNKSNLYYSIFNLSFGLVFLWLIVEQNFLNPDFGIMMRSLGSMLQNFYAPALLAMLYTIFYKKLPKIYWLWFTLFAIDFITTLLNIDSSYLGLFNLSVFIIESLRIIIVSMFKKREGAWIIGGGIITTILFFTVYFIIAALNDGEINYSQRGWMGAVLGLVIMLATLSIPLSMTIFLARDFAKVNRNLEKKLVEVEELSEKTIEQEKEKQQLLADQNSMLERQVRERTHEITEQKKIIEEKNKDITDSINYAKRIQNAMLPAKELKYRLFPEAFVLFLPKDIVSGDFYWFAEKNGKRLIAAADCTGHGVPGALMSMVGNNILHQLVNEKGITAPDEILNFLHKEVRTALKQHEQSETRDGMDIALCTITPLENGLERIEYAGAHRPLWIADGNGLSEIKADKYPIGGTQAEVERKFTKHTLEIKRGDSFYIFSDGFADQFSVSDKKVMTRKFKEILLSIQQLPMAEQEKHLEKFHLDWKGSMEQTDDVLVIGVRV